MQLSNSASAAGNSNGQTSIQMAEGRLPRRIQRSSRAARWSEDHRSRASRLSLKRSVTVLAAVCLALLACLVVQPASAHMIELLPAAKECFFEDLHIGDQMTLTYQVGGGGHLDIDTYLVDPNKKRLFELYRKDTGTYSFTAQHDGRYEYCFSNEFSTVSDKTVSFNVHGIIYVPDDGEMLPIEREIRDLAAGLQQIKDEQEYLVVREKTHRNTAESTNTRVKWWSVIQGIMLTGVCGVQIFFVKRQFEVRRVI